MNLIVAMDKNQAIGKNNGLLVHSKKDMEYFKEMTTGKIVVMGMNTYLSLPKKFRPLPNRLNIVITRNRTVNNEGVLVARSMEELFSILRGMDTNNVFVIGGASIYKELFPYCDKLYITRIMKEFSEADTYFPKFNQKEWNLVNSRRERDEGLLLHFNVYEKRSKK